MAGDFLAILQVDGPLYLYVPTGLIRPMLMPHFRVVTAGRIGTNGALPVR